MLPSCPRAPSSRPRPRAQVFVTTVIAEVIGLLVVCGCVIVDAERKRDTASVYLGVLVAYAVLSFAYFALDAVVGEVVFQLASALTAHLLMTIYAIWNNFAAADDYVGAIALPLSIGGRGPAVVRRCLAFLAHFARVRSLAVVGSFHLLYMVCWTRVPPPRMTRTNGVGRSWARP
jgi:hypothetical protein